MNEQAPVFDPVSYTAAVPEDLTVAAEVGVTVQATDPEGHAVVYSIDPEFQDGNFFAVSSSSGVVTLAQSLDRDPPSGHDMFTFQVYIM